MASKTVKDMTAGVNFARMIFARMISRT